MLVSATAAMVCTMSAYQVRSVSCRARTPFVEKTRPSLARFLTGRPCGEAPASRSPGPSIVREQRRGGRYNLGASARRCPTVGPDRCAARPPYRRGRHGKPLTWLVRFLHVLGAAFWVGGYAVMALVVIPLLADGQHEPIRRVALGATRVLSFSGTLTILAGAFLVARTRGYGRLLGGEWGAIVIACAVLAFALMAIGDAGLRPALRRLGPDAGGSVAVAQRWAVAGLLLGVVALAFMTRALYAAT